MSNLTKDSLSPFAGLSKKAKGLRFLSLIGIASIAFSPLHADIEGGGDTTIGGNKHNGLFFGVEAGVSAQLSKQTIVENTQTNTTTTTITTTKNGDIFPLGAVGLKFGYTHFFNRWAGLRGYATYHYVYNYTYGKENTNTRTVTTATGQLTPSTAGNNNPNTTTESTATLNSYHQVAANIEAVFKFANIGNSSAIGGFIGLGAGYADSYTRVNTQPTTGAGTITTTQGPSGFVLPVNIGLELYVGRHHNASLAFRLPTIAPDLVTTGANSAGIAGMKTTTDEMRQLIITAGYYYKF